MKQVLISGGTGLIGTALTAMLKEKGYKVVILTRKARPDKDGVSYSEWNVEEKRIDDEVVANSNFIINLAGENVAEKRWTKERKQQIIDSRSDAAMLLADSINKNPGKIEAVVSASAIGFYGPDPKVTNTNPFTEEMPHHMSFLGSTTEIWERSIELVERSNRRLVILRTGIVLSTKGGAFLEFLKPMKFGIAPIMGSGKQVISWIHIDDICRMYIYAMENESMHGKFNAVAPYIVTNKKLVLETAKQYRGRFFIPIHIPESVLKTMLGEMSIEVLKSTSVSADKIRKAGFQFLFPTISAAVQDLLKK